MNDESIVEQESIDTEVSENNIELKPIEFKKHFTKTIRYGILTGILFLILVTGLQNVYDPYDDIYMGNVELDGLSWYHVSYLVISILTSIFIFAALSNLSKVSWFYLEGPLSKKGIREVLIKGVFRLCSLSLAYLLLMPIINEIFTEINVIETFLDYYGLSTDLAMLAANSIFVLIGIVYVIPFIKGFFGMVDSIGKQLEEKKKVIS